MKRRSGGHERSIRELRVGADTLTAGAPPSKFQGILSGTPMPLEPLIGKGPMNG